MSAYVLVVEGLEQLEDISKLDDKLVSRARQAINRTMQRTRTQASREMRSQINFGARYLSGQAGRLKVTQKATNSNLSSTLRGADRPTLLARFATSKSVAASRKNGVRVQVKPGETVHMKGAFLLNLRGGNLGVAVRLKPGESIRNKKFMAKMSGGLYVLYGPAVNQVFSNVAEDLTPDALDFLEREFARLMEL